MRGVDISNRRFLQGFKQRALFEAYNGAMDFVNEGFGGPKAAVKSGKFPGIDHQALTRKAERNRGEWGRRLFPQSVIFYGGKGACTLCENLRREHDGSQQKTSVIKCGIC